MQITPLDALLAHRSTYRQRPNVEQAATEFEALLLGEWLKSARETVKISSGKDSSEMDGYVDFAEEHLARALAESDVLGFAKMIASRLKTGGL